LHAKWPREWSWQAQSGAIVAGLVVAALVALIAHFCAHLTMGSALKKDVHPIAGGGVTMGLTRFDGQLACADHAAWWVMSWLSSHSTGLQ
jgi:hypothetical protein